MRLPDSLVEKLLEDSGKFNPDQIKKFIDQETKEKKALQDIVVDGQNLSEEELTKLYAKEIDAEFVQISDKDIKKEFLELLPERIARQYKAIIINVDDDKVISLAMENPDDIQAINFLRKQLGNNLKFYITTSSALQIALDHYRNNIGSELTKVISTEENTEEQNGAETEEDLAEDSPVAKSVNIIIEYAISAGASDIHIEPREDYVLIRYRIDGILKEANKLPKKILNSLVSRVKILANLKIDEHRAPQDGRFKIESEGTTYALRVSTLPIVEGEKVVMRILNESTKASDFNQLGFWGMALEELNNAIIQPHGMVLVTGPTGSGKSTTLFSVLSKLNTPDINISTIEDPVEYHINGANQTQVNPIAGMTFASGLRSLLRQDPNIIMVGEIRDKETADLAVQAALTGHLVFSTLHTNDAATCLPRLLDMGVEPFLIATTIRIVIGQRLVRKICPDCASRVEVDKDMLEHIIKDFKIDEEGFKNLNQLEEAAIKDKIYPVTKDTNEQEMSSSDKSIKYIWKASQDGCDTCNHSGYKGRIGIYEVLPNSETLQHMILTNTSSEDIEKNATNNQGMVSMKMDGLVKSLRGQTTIEEVLRVTSSN